MIIDNLIKPNQTQKFNTIITKLEPILSYARGNNIPVLLTETAELLFNCASNLNPKSVLEIGTAIGYSGSILLNACNCELTTIEKFEASSQIAKEHFENLNLNTRVKLCVGDAKDVILNLEQNNKKFDFIFLDGPKGQYIKYLPILKKLLNAGGVLFADNVYFKNMVFMEGTIPHKKRTIVVNLRKFLETMKTDGDFVSQEYNVGDGIVIAKLKG